MQKQDVSIRLMKEDLRILEMMAEIMGMSVEELTAEAVKSFLYTTKCTLRGIEMHVFPVIDYLE